MKTIYLNKADMRSYSTSSNTVWDTIELQVPLDFEGGGKYYDPESKTWIDDVIPEPTNEEIKQQKKTELTQLIAQKEQELLIANLRGKDISTILKDLGDLEKELAEYD